MRIRESIPAITIFLTCCFIAVLLRASYVESKEMTVRYRRQLGACQIECGKSRATILDGTCFCDLTKRLP